MGKKIHIRIGDRADNKTIVKNSPSLSPVVDNRDTIHKKQNKVDSVKGVRNG